MHPCPSPPGAWCPAPAALRPTQPGAPAVGARAPPAARAPRSPLMGPLAACSTGHRLQRLRNARHPCVPRPPQASRGRLR